MCHSATREGKKKKKMITRVTSSSHIDYDATNGSVGAADLFEHTQIHCSPDLYVNHFLVEARDARAQTVRARNKPWDNVKTQIDDTERDTFADSCENRRIILKKRLFCLVWMFVCLRREEWELVKF